MVRSLPAWESSPITQIDNKNFTQFYETQDGNSMLKSPKNWSGEKNLKLLFLDFDVLSNHALIFPFLVQHCSKSVTTSLSAPLKKSLRCKRSGEGEFIC